MCAAPHRTLASTPPRSGRRGRVLVVYIFFAMASAAIRPDKRSRHKSLASLLRFFEGVECSIELKTGKIYKGNVSSSDDSMNIQLDDCIVPNQKSRLAHVHIRGSNIRYIHFPDDADLTGLIRSGVDRERAAANKYKRGLRKK
jgi:small nuclear ribonucleoprotein (snRNP)-like protein